MVATATSTPGGAPPVDGHPLPEAAWLSDVGRTSVYNYLRAFARGGATALEDAPRRLPRKLPVPYAGDGESHGAWRRLLARRPSTIAEVGTSAHAWTLRLLVFLLLPDLRGARRAALRRRRGRPPGGAPSPPRERVPRPTRTAGDGGSGSRRAVPGGRVLRGSWSLLQARLLLWAA